MAAASQGRESTVLCGGTQGFDRKVSTEYS